MTTVSLRSGTTDGAVQYNGVDVITLRAGTADMAYTPDGGVATTVAAKLAESVSVTDFETLSLAFAGSASNTLYIPPGTYDLGSSTLIIPSNIRIVGAGRGAVSFTYSGAGVAFDGYGNGNISLEGFSITCSNDAAIGLRLGGGGQHFILKDLGLLGTTASGNTGTGLLLESIHPPGADIFSGHLSADLFYTLGFKYGIRFLGDSTTSNRTWTTCSFTQTFLIGKGSGVISGSKGFYVDNFTCLSGSSFLGGTVEGYETGLSVDTCTWPTNSGIEWDADIEACTTSYVVGDTFQGRVNLNPAAKQYKASANATDNVWTKELNDSGVMVRESYYSQKTVIYNGSGAWSGYVGASLINYGSLSGGGSPTLIWNIGSTGNFQTAGNVLALGTSIYQKTTVGTAIVTSSGKQTTFPIQNSKTMTFSPSFGKLFIITLGNTGEAGLFWASYNSATITSVGPLPASIELSSTPSTAHIGIYKSANAQTISIVAGDTAGTTLSNICISIVGSDQTYSPPTDWA